MTNEMTLKERKAIENKVNVMTAFSAFMTLATFVYAIQTKPMTRTMLGYDTASEFFYWSFPLTEQGSQIVAFLFGIFLFTIAFGSFWYSLHMHRKIKY